MATLDIAILIPDAFLVFLTDRARYKVAFGGRGAAKTETFIRILIYECLQYPHRVLCCREIQNSIEESTKLALEDIMAEMGLLGPGKFFQRTKKSIVGRNGSRFMFEGLYRNANKIKSYKGITRCFIDEAQMISANSFKYLRPTMRDMGSEFLIVFNPENADDAVYRRFVEDAQGNAVTPRWNWIVRKINFTQNPFFNAVLRDEMLEDRETDYENYLHVWEGELNTVSEALIFSKKFVVKDFVLSEEADLNYGADWGFSQDPTTLLRAYVDEKRRRIYVDYEACKKGVEIDHIAHLFDTVPGARLHTIRADSAYPATISFVKRAGFKIIGAKKGPGSVEDGIKFLRGYTIVVHSRCVHLLHEFKNYKYKINTASGDVTRIIIDAHNHLIDSLRYALEPLIQNRMRKIRIGFAKW